MKAGWEVKPLGAIAEFVMGQAPAGKDCNKDGVGTPFVKAGEFGEFRPVIREWTTDPKKHAKSTDVLICVVGATCGKINLGADCAIGRSAAAIRPRPKELDQYYLHYFLEGKVQEFREGSLGAAQTVISKIMLSEMAVPLPPLGEQKRIVAVLDAAFEGLTRARANIETNLQNARELFDATTNQYILGHSGEETEQPQENNIASLGSEIQVRKNDKKFRGPVVVGASDFPVLPTSWMWSSPEQLSTNIVDCLHATPKWSDSGKVCLRTTNFRPNDLDLTTTRFVSEETYQQRIVRLEPKPNDVLYSREGGILGIACIHPEGLEACLGQRMMMFRLRQDWILPHYFCWVMNSDFVLREVRQLTGGAAAPHLNIGDIRKFPIPVPPMAIQQKIVKKLDNFKLSHSVLVAGMNAKLQDLDDLRQSLLQKAFAGELT